MSHSEPETNMVLDGATIASSTSTSTSPLLEVSNAIARLHKQYVGRGPANVRTVIEGDLVTVVLEGGYTRAEETLGANDMGELVAAGRVGLQDAMRQALVASVSEILGREVHSFMSANDLEQGLQAEVFVLAPADAEADGAA